ncbi:MULTISPECIES: anti-phage dCTP deaminase [Halocynthiibacter]|uniref:Anti-phage dCTP deaminase n=1 Tax=Halocynthiibacter halioticoli TaxID=2986804 RepID=A0AAE3IW41_9RHOB|nr:MULTISPECIES: anti-phage dCTP deaminase [Halocynthiibacter]MCV6823158.1 anti-phage dCTP deaminase [Halocynthiibacter halioticoli]MCW4056159.1 anti-phage dCTP deaminase [Halocynthiibacter sp. SDUM655004]
MSNRVELVFGLVGPIGCPIHQAGDILASTLKKMDYIPVTVSLSSEMDRLLKAKGSEVDGRFDSALEEKILKGNKVRETFNNNGVLAAEAIRQIVEYRKGFAKNRGETNAAKINERALIPLDEHAFIIDQLKRPEEVELLIKAFGKRFVQVSVVTSLEQRRQSLVARLRSEQHSWDNERCEAHAGTLIATDQNERSDERGQRISKIFHLGDVFFDGTSEDSLERSSQRFIKAFFGRNNVAPTRDEFGSYMAKAASLRSVDLSRQVGAAIVTSEGDLISVGCNEVPKYGGGNYWDEDADKKRDIDLGGEANKNEINRIISDFLGVLEKQGIIAKGQTVNSILQNDGHRKAIKGSLIAGVTEYGRMVHAEMNALSDAARLGRSLKGASIFVTTYPCHNCAKHLIAAGIERIVFIEPYPKSKTESLFQNIVGHDATESAKVSIEHFFGISPRRYRDIFEKGSRQTKEGEVIDWYKGEQAPRLGNIEVGAPARVIYAVLENLYAVDTISTTD